MGWGLVLSLTGADQKIQPILDTSHIHKYKIRSCKTITHLLFPPVEIMNPPLQLNKYKQEGFLLVMSPQCVTLTNNFHVVTASSVK